MKLLKHWRVKGAIQGALSALPGGKWVNDQLQLVAGDLRDFDTNVSRKVEDWAGIVAYLDSAGFGRLEGRDFVEIGTGWYPTLPMCFVLAGARTVHTVDLNPHLSAAMSFRALVALRRHLGLIAERSARSLEAVQATYDRLARTRDVDALLAAGRISYKAPQDAARLDWMGDESVDVVYSNSVLEHVVPAAIGPIMCEANRVLKREGVMVHAVACNDHYAHFDRDISFVNYLSYSENAWRRWNNDLLYQNRLRAPDFLRIATESGFRIIHEAHAVRPGTREALANMKVAPEFRHYSLDDLAATTVDFVASKSGTEL
mgnify:CR=1 FL=1